MKRLLMICFAVLLLCQATVFAHEMPDDEMYLGGITAGVTLGYVKNIFGIPQQKIPSESPQYRFMVYTYPPSVVVHAETLKDNPSSEEEMIVSSINVKDNSLTTPSGITVGTPYDSIKTMFGECSREFQSRNKMVYFYQGNGKHIAFVVDKNGIISAITVSVRTGNN